MREVHRRFAAWFSWLDESQEDVGLRLGCSQAFVSQLLSGERSVGLKIAIHIERESADWPAGPILSSEWIADDIQREAS